MIHAQFVLLQADILFQFLAFIATHLSWAWLICSVVTQRKCKVTEERYSVLVTSGGHLTRRGNDGKATYKIPPHIKYLLHPENKPLYPYKTPMYQYYYAAFDIGIQYQVCTKDLFKNKQ
jgi:hypothetical protein